MMYYGGCVPKSLCNACADFIVLINKEGLTQYRHEAYRMPRIKLIKLINNLIFISYIHLLLVYITNKLSHNPMAGLANLTQTCLNTHINNLFYRKGYMR